MVSGVGGADWFEVASRLAQAETDIGLGRIVDTARPAKSPSAGRERVGEKGSNPSQAEFVLASDKEKGIPSIEKAKSRDAVFGPPSPPLKRHAAPLFKAGKVGSSADAQSNRKQKQGQSLVELDDVTGEQQCFESRASQEEERPAKADGAQSGEDDWELEDGERGIRTSQEGEL